MWAVLIVTTAVSVISAAEAAWGLVDQYAEKDALKNALVKEMAEADIRHDIAYNYSYLLYENARDEQPSLSSVRRGKEIADKYSYGSTNLGFVLYNMEGEIIAGCSDYRENANIYPVSYRVDVESKRSYYYSETGDYGYREAEETRYVESYTIEGCKSVEEAIDSVTSVYGDRLVYAHIICGYIRTDFKVQDKYSVVYRAADKVRNNLNLEIITFAVTVVINVLCLITLMCGAGRRVGDTEPSTAGAVRVPFDIFLTAAAVLIAFGFALIFSFSYIIVALPLAGIWLWMSVIAVYGLAVFAAAQIKARTLLKCSVIGRVVSLIIRMFKGLFHLAVRVFRSVPLVWKTVVIVLGYTLIDFIFVMLIADAGEFILLWFMLHVGIIVIAILFAAGLKYLGDSGKKIADGDTDYRVDVRRLYGDMRRHGENLNNISGGISHAVDERMKSERLKTELITNVSHDIKTPLTSIINYADLLKKEPIESENAREYIDVIDRQSARLKKLITDLIDASKASSGSIKTDMAPTSIGIIAEQAAGEYEGRMAAAGLELVMSDNSGGAFVMVDGKLLWRVLDNLLGNACKYSMKGSRVYMTIEKSGPNLLLSIMNISGERLNITADELKERFVRGDSSRNTEGSGLGLSITESLMKIMNGDLNLYIEGDLFKAVLRFDLIV